MSRLYVARGEDRVLDPAARSEAHGSFVELSDGITHYRLTGPRTGPLVVLTPGITIPLGYWDPVAERLHTHGFRTLAYSAYGRGWSDRVERRYDPDLFLRQLAELLGSVAPRRRAHLVGTSMGGLIAMAHATQNPAAEPLSVSLIGPAGLARRRPAFAPLLACEPPTRLLGRLLGRRLLDSHLGHNVRSREDTERLRLLVAEPYRFHGSVHALLSTLRDFPLTGRHDLYRQAGRLPVPKLLLWGRHDRVTPIDRLGTVRNLFVPDACHVLDHCGHMVPFEDPHSTAELLAAFFSTTTGDRSA